MLTNGYFLMCIGLCFIMATIQYFQHRDFWSNRNIYPFDAAPYCFKYILNWNCFENILNALTITDETLHQHKNNSFGMQGS